MLMSLLTCARTLNYKFWISIGMDLINYLVNAMQCLAYITFTNILQFEIDTKFLFPSIASLESMPANLATDVITEAIKANKGKKSDVLFNLLRDHTDAGRELFYITIFLFLFFFLMKIPINIAVSRNILWLMVLPTLFPTFFIKRKRSTKAEIVSNFIPYFEVKYNHFIEIKSFHIKMHHLCIPLSDSSRERDIQC